MQPQTTNQLTKKLIKKKLHTITSCDSSQCSAILM